MARNERDILDDDDPPVRSAGRDESRAGFEWGLSSVLIGLTFLVVGAVSMLFCLILYNRGGSDHGLSRLDLYLASIGSAVCVAGALTICIVVVVFGFRGRAQARRENQPGALARASILLCSGGIILWLIVGIDFFA